MGFGALGYSLAPIGYHGIARSAASSMDTKPNFVIVFTDDQGYGDLGCYGSETIHSPRFQPVCGPSRSALLTGRYPVRSRGWSMPESEITFAELLKTVGYTTGCIGKWDVSNRRDIKGRVPNDQGFDYYWGTLGANDSGAVKLYDNRQPIGVDRNMAGLTKRYTDKGIEFLKANKDRPFFAHTMAHSVVDATVRFKGKSKGGLYGDVIEELDYHTGRLLDAIDELGLRDNTLVIFTTDNGPWNNMQEILRKKHKGAVAWGSSGPLREGKGSTWEGGVRVPCIIRWPGHVPAGRVCGAIFSTVDFMPTLANLAGYEVPKDRIIDGVDQTALLLGESEEGARDHLYYLCRNALHGVRKGKWKLLLPNRENYYNYVKDRGSKEMELYNLESDIGERRNLAEQNPEIVSEMLELIKAFQWPARLPDTNITPKKKKGM
jgi:arylsulfatase A-like enzyme